MKHNFLKKTIYELFRGLIIFTYLGTKEPLLRIWIWIRVLGFRVTIYRENGKGRRDEPSLMSPSLKGGQRDLIQEVKHDTLAYAIHLCLFSRQ